MPLQLCVETLFALTISRRHRCMRMKVCMNAGLRCVKHSDGSGGWEKSQHDCSQINSDSPSLSSGDLHGPSPVPAGAAGARGPSERRGGARPVGQPLLGAPVRHQRRRGALQYPGPPLHAEEPDCSGGRPSPRLPHLLLGPTSLPLPLTSGFICPACETFLRRGRGFSHGDAPLKKYIYIKSDWYYSCGPYVWISFPPLKHLTGPIKIYCLLSAKLLFIFTCSMILLLWGIISWDEGTASSFYTHLYPKIVLSEFPFLF